MSSRLRSGDVARRVFSGRGVRGNIDISVVSPWGIPIPASGPASTAILDRFRERNISFVPSQAVTAINAAAKTARLRDGMTMPYDLFLGIPVHRVPAVVEASGLAVDGWIPVDKANLSTFRTCTPSVTSPARRCRGRHLRRKRCSPGGHRRETPERKQGRL
jgi:hypothetical protein